MKRFVQAVINLLFILPVVSGIAHADQLALPAADVTAPVMEQKNLVTRIEAGKDYQILVTATDNVGVKDVILFYRNTGDKVYQNKVMRHVPNTDDYSLTLSASELRGDGLEYYIQATDQAGNALLLGYAFSPIAVVVEHPPLKEQVASSSAMDSTIPMKTSGTAPEKKYESESSYKWLWIGLGVLAVGALASSGGGGGGGDSGGTSGAPSGEPTVIINAPVP